MFNVSGEIAEKKSFIFATQIHCNIVVALLAIHVKDFTHFPSTTHSNKLKNRVPLTAHFQSVRVFCAYVTHSALDEMRFFFLNPHDISIDCNFSIQTKDDFVES